MELILWRHAEAEDSSPDLARRLTPKGEKQARRMAEWLQTHLPDSAKLLASPAVRTQQTAQALADLSGRTIKTVDALAPGASADDIFDAANWPNSRTAVVIVGHQPTLGTVAARLLASYESSMTIKKAAAWWFSSRLRDGAQETVLRVVMNSEML
jgi:phosphohistidine phosphatase